MSFIRLQTDSLFYGRGKGKGEGHSPSALGLLC
jgi:hypothetical protein